MFSGGNKVEIQFAVSPTKTVGQNVRSSHIWGGPANKATIKYVPYTHARKFIGNRGTGAATVVCMSKHASIGALTFVAVTLMGSL